MKHALLLAPLLFVTPVLADDDLVWIGNAFDGGASLAFALPESDYAPLALYCETGSGMVNVSYSFEPVDATEGVEVPVLLRAGDIEIAIAMTGARSEMDDLFILDGTTPMDARFADLITSRGTLAVVVEDGAEEYDLEGAREAAQPLLEACAPQ